jgi:hypothetical protein
MIMCLTVLLTLLKILAKVVLLSDEIRKKIMKIPQQIMKRWLQTASTSMAQDTKLMRLNLAWKFELIQAPLNSV